MRAHLSFLQRLRWRPLFQLWWSGMFIVPEAIEEQSSVGATCSGWRRTFLGHAAPTELEKFMERPRFYKHDAPLELARHTLPETEMRPLRIPRALPASEKWFISLLT